MYLIATLLSRRTSTGQEKGLTPEQLPPPSDHSDRVLGPEWLAQLL